ncbi:hypothetical protein GCM10010218_31560 [Streptomyces mashuensis]|uniref:Uncharacterized protein n=1 Tax=Streptomyces mashuensis TaxID=33904 RepID=A0A919EDB6_9ACTN|nr:hypothetical protein [Streptomyces mashuensis]GHF47825.1 hypothetical protein GCM10010218_31560 [Streptomyces mashuensis]
MSEKSELMDAYDRLYSAAARMMWAQMGPHWRDEDEESEWPAAWRKAWQHLEQVLLDAEAALGAPQPGEASDPARHLISRRAPGGVDRPLTFDEAVRDWKQRLDADPGYLVERGKPYWDYYMEPGSCVVIPSAPYFGMIGIFPELFHRLAPGRPEVTIGPGAADLGAVAHEAADALRAPLGVTTPTPYPGGSPWISPVSRRVSELPDLPERFETLRRAAWHAAEPMPSPESLMGSLDFTVHLKTAVAAADIRQMLAGQPAPAWREEYEQIDPARHGVVGLVSGPGDEAVPVPFEEEAADWRELNAKGATPWTPKEYQRQYYPDRGEAENVVISATRALVFAEILDEFAARLTPGRHSGLIHYSAYELGQFLIWGIGRELRAHSGF